MKPQRTLHFARILRGGYDAAEPNQFLEQRGWTFLNAYKAIVLLSVM
jgi:hypothetical protein